MDKTLKNVLSKEFLIGGALSMDKLMIEKAAPHA